MECDICGGTGTDYIGRPCRLCSLRDAVEKMQVTAEAEELTALEAKAHESPTHSKVPTPGEHHPAVAKHAQAIRYAHYGTFQVPVYTGGDNFFADDPDDYLKTEVSILTFTGQKAAQSLYPEYGHYVWHVWTDKHGRYVTDEEARWVPAEGAWVYPQWNPPRKVE